MFIYHFIRDLLLLQFAYDWPFNTLIYSGRRAQREKRKKKTKREGKRNRQTDSCVEIVANTLSFDTRSLYCKCLLIGLFYIFNWISCVLFSCFVSPFRANRPGKSWLDRVIWRGLFDSHAQSAYKFVRFHSYCFASNFCAQFILFFLVAVYFVTLVP